MSEDDLLKDQRGSPAYISPDVLSGRQAGPSAAAHIPTRASFRCAAQRYMKTTSFCSHM